MQNLVTDLLSIEQKKREVSMLLRGEYQGYSIDDAIFNKVTRFIGDCQVVIKGFTESENGVNFYISVLKPEKSREKGVSQLRAPRRYKTDLSLDGSYVPIDLEGNVGLALNSSGKSHNPTDYSMNYASMNNSFTNYSYGIDNSYEMNNNDNIHSHTKWKKVSILLSAFLIISAFTNANLLKYKKAGKEAFEFKKEANAQLEFIKESLKNANKYITKDGTLKDLE